MFDHGGRTGRVLLVLGIVAVVLVFLAIGVYREVGAVGLTGLNVVVSGILTAALVILYFQQTDILDSQRELLTQELNRGARQQHTETLRKRVAIWHGDPEMDEPTEPFDEPTLNLPRVYGATFQSASVNGYTHDLDDDSFHVLPIQLRGDRYLTDLLENHAPDLRETAEKITQLHEEFVGLRATFVEEFDEGPARETEEYILEPQDRFGRWLFELLVLLEREQFDDFNELRDRAWAAFERGNNGPHSDKPQLFIRVELRNRISTPVYVATWQEDIDRETIRDHQETVEDEVADIIEDVLDRVELERPYERTVEATETLDAAAEKVYRLENLLVEYHGRPIYPGDCKYLEETQIEDM